MYKVEILLEGSSPIVFSKYHSTPKKAKESPADYETRTWREKAHYDSQENVFVPGTMIASCIREAAKFLSQQVPGKGKATFTKHFDAGIQVNNNAMIGIKKKDLIPLTLFVPSNGQRGGGTRVEKTFPYIPEGWLANFTIFVIDTTITEEVMKYHLQQAGLLIGMGSFRPRNRGIYGRFRLKDYKWTEMEYRDI